MGSIGFEMIQRMKRYLEAWEHVHVNLLEARSAEIGDALGRILVCSAQAPPRTICICSVLVFTFRRTKNSDPESESEVPIPLKLYSVKCVD